MSDIFEGLEGEENLAESSGTTEGENLISSLEDEQARQEEQNFTDRVFQDDQVRAEVVAFLADEIEDVDGNAERATQIEKWQKWRRQRQVSPEQLRKTTPWNGASNVVPPLSLSKQQTINAKIKSSFAKREPFWTIKATDSALTPHAKALQNYINYLGSDPGKINIRRKNTNIIHDNTTFGFQVVSVPWRNDVVRHRLNSDVDGENSVTELQTIYNGPDVSLIAPEDVFIRSYFTNIQTAPWFAVRNHMFLHELKKLQARGIFQNVEQIEAVFEDLPEQDQTEAEIKGLRPQIQDDPHTKEYYVYECYVYWDIEGDGIVDDIIIWFEPETQTVLRAEFNKLPRRPFVKFDYTEVPGHFFSLGIGQVLEGLQDEIETLHNMAIDATHLSVTPERYVRRGCGIVKTTEYRPAATREVDDPINDVAFKTWPNPAPVTLQRESLAQQYASEASGAAAQLSGFDVSKGNRLGASGTMFLANQSNSVLDAARENIAEALGEVGHLIVLQLALNKDIIDFGGISEEEQRLIQELFDRPMPELLSKLQLIVKSTPVNKTEDAQRDNAQSMGQLYAGYIQQTMQLSQAVAQGQPNPNNPGWNIAASGLVGSTKLMREVLKNFIPDDPDTYLPNVAQIERILRQHDEQINQQLGIHKNSQGDIYETEGTSTGTLGLGGGSDASPGGNGSSGASAGTGGQTLSNRGTDATANQVSGGQSVGGGTTGSTA